jgi:hypothetical protein
MLRRLAVAKAVISKKRIASIIRVTKIDISSQRSSAASYG